jgi:hypothetical protein
MQERIYQPMWLALSKEVRNKLTEVFKLVPTATREIRDNTVLCDGFSNEDLSGISAIKMEEYVGSKESFHRMWEITLSKVNFELNPPTLITPPPKVPTEVKLEPETPIFKPPFCDKCTSKGGRHIKNCINFK